MLVMPNRGWWYQPPSRNNNEMVQVISGFQNSRGSASTAEMVKKFLKSNTIKNLGRASGAGFFSIETSNFRWGGTGAGPELRGDWYMVHRWRGAIPSSAPPPPRAKDKFFLEAGMDN